MPPTQSNIQSDENAFHGYALLVRSAIGGALMGLANLVPGISGGTMLLAVGVYPQFISGVAEVSTFSLRPRVILMLGTVVAAAVIAIVGFARLISIALDQFEWGMYSLFIGLTLGGIPLIWRTLKPADRVSMSSAFVAVVLMALLATLDPDRLGGSGEPGFASYIMLIIAGCSGGAAMILPGLSGAYLLLILGQYRTIVEAVAFAGDAVRTGTWALAFESFHVLIPVGLGVVVGVVSVSNLMKMLLTNYQRATLGFLLGLLVGAVIGLWPFTQSVLPQLGDVVRGVELLTPDMVEAVDPRYYRRVAVVPSLWQLSVGVGLALIGFGVSWGISRVGE